MENPVTIYRESVEETSVFAEIATAALQTPIEFMRYCASCQSEQRFVAGCQCCNGLLGACAACGMPGFEPFTRSISEAA